MSQRIEQQPSLEMIDLGETAEPAVEASRFILQFTEDVDRLVADCPEAFVNFPDLVNRLASQLQIVEKSAMQLTSTAEISVLEHQIWQQVTPEHRQLVSALCEYISTTISDINSHRSVSRFARR